MGTTHKKGVLRGPKFNARHSTYIPGAEPVILAAKARREVTKIVLGPIHNAGGGSPRITFKTIQAGLMVTIRGSMSLQKLYVYTPTPDATAAAIEHAAT